MPAIVGAISMISIGSASVFHIGERSTNFNLFYMPKPSQDLVPLIQANSSMFKIIKAPQTPMTQT